MNCEDWTLHINAFLDADLSAPEVASLTAHLSTCPACVQMLGELAAVRGAIAALDVDEVPSAALVARVHAIVDGRPGKARALRPRWRPRWRPLWPWATGLAASMALAASVLLMLPPAKNVQPDLMSVRDAALRVSLAQEAAAKVQAVPGFILVSSRQDLVAGHVAQVAVYRRGDAVITLCAWSAGREPAHGVINAHYRGMAISYWNDGREEYWAASAAPGSDLGAFVQAMHGTRES